MARNKIGHVGRPLETVQEIKQRKKDTRASAVLVLLWVFAVIALVVLSAKESKANTEFEKLDKGVQWLVENHKVPARDNPIFRKQIINQFKKSAIVFNLPVYLIIGIGYRESIFRLNELGPGGELGIMQVCPYGIRKCKKYCGQMKTMKEQIDCGSCWLDKGRTWCGNLEKGLIAYLSGKCKIWSKRTRRAFNIRMRLWKKLKEF